MTSTPELPWHNIPPSKTGSTCKVYLMQAGGLDLPNDLVFLPGPNKSNSSLDESFKGEMETFFVPDFVFLIEHVATGKKYIFDLGMRKDLENSTPAVVERVLPKYRSEPVSIEDILKEYGTAEQQPTTFSAVIFSHLHFDHFGDFGKAGFDRAELWIGPTSCTLARPGYPADPNGMVFSNDLPGDGSKKIVEFELPPNLLGDRRRAFDEAVKTGKYDGIQLLKPSDGWFGLGAFEAAFDLLHDESVYVIDAPGHTAGHQMLLVRVKLNSTGADDFVLLAGDCYHHPALLKSPLSTARPPFSKFSMHRDPSVAIETVFRTRRCAEEENIWAVGAHDFSVQRAIDPSTNTLLGLVELTEWRDNGWKRQ
jgi:glyoxylase-like metal-dependent hydrolase (beta-lactamase superfamily II)